MDTAEEEPRTDSPTGHAAQRPIPRDVLLRMLRREDQLRRSEETQRAYDACGRFEVPPFSIEESIQAQVLREFGYDPDSEDDMNEYRYTHGRYLNDPGIVVKLQRARGCFGDAGRWLET